MVTERTFCDFVLYAKNGPVLVERIYRGEPLIADVLRTLSGFWKRVIGAETFESQRIFHPLWCQVTFLSPPYNNISAVATMDIDGPVAHKDTEDPSVSHDSSPVATMDNDNAVATRDTNDSSNTHDNSSPMATKDNGDQSVTHGNR